MPRISHWVSYRFLVGVASAVLMINTAAMTTPARPAATRVRPVARPRPEVRILSSSPTAGEPSVWPSYATMNATSNSTGNYADFEISNTDWNAENYSLYCYYMYPVTSCDVPWSVYVDGYGTASVFATFSTGSPGSGGVSLSAGGMIGGADGHYDVTVQDARMAPTLAARAGADLRDVSRCVVDCFEKTMSYSPPTYVSLDVPRTTNLVYRSNSAHPTAVVQLDATDNSAVQADIYELQLQRQDGSYVTFLNGTQALFFQSAGHYVATRLAGAFDAIGLGTGRYTYTAIVTSIWNSDGWQQTAYNTVHVMVLNESASPFGAGWTVSGAQRAYVQSDGVLVADGSGSASFFSGNCAPNTLCTFVSPGGEFSTFQQQYSNYHRIYPDGTDVTFWPDGREVMQTDRYGNITFYTYNGPNGTLSMIEDPANIGTIFGFENGSGGWKVGTVRSVQTPGGRTAWLGVDANNDLRQVLDVDQASLEYIDYDGSHRLSHYRDRRGGDWNYTYSQDGTVASGLAPTITVAGNQSQRPTTTYLGGSSNILNAITGTVGSRGNAVPASLDIRASVRNPRGFTSYYTLNMWGEAATVRDALGRSTLYGYDDNTGQLKNVTYQNGHNVQYTYDGPRLTRVYDATTGATINRAYETTYNRPTHVWGNTVEQWFYYTGARMDSSRYGSSSAAVTKFSTDAKGRVWKTTDPGGHIQTTFFATAGYQNTDSLIEPGHRVTAFRYDGYGRTRAMQPSMRPGDSTVYDLLNRRVASVDIATQRRTSYEYDALYLTAVTDAKNQRYSFTRNALGWIEQELRPGSASALVNTFDANGNILTFRNRRQQTTTFTYDALDRVTQRSTASGNTTYGYGFSEDFASVANAASTDTMFYDSGHRLARMKTWRGTSWYQLQYSYNLDGTQSRLDATSNMWTGSHGPQYYYFPAGGLQYLDDLGKRIVVNPNGENVTTSIGLSTGLLNTTSRNSIHETFENSYSYGTDANNRLGTTGKLDDMGRIAERRRTSGDANGDSLRTYVYNLDGTFASRQFWTTTSPTCHFDLDYGYVCDEGSQQLSNTDPYAYDEVGNILNGVTAIDYPGNRIRAANGYSYSYDEDGNLVSKTGPGYSQTLTWNELGQLTNVTTNGIGAAFTYDGFGRRVSGERYYLYDGDNLFMELDGGGRINAEYAFWPGVDRPLMVSRGNELMYFSLDPVSGSVHGLIRDGDNVVRAQYGYTPYGQLETGAFDYTWLGNPLRYAAREYDTRSGLYYFRARYYDPELGRFISEDPVGLSGGVNLYAYAGNDPVNGSDPSGLRGIKMRLFGVRWRAPWRDIGHYGGPVAAFVGIAAAELLTGGTATSAFLAAGEAVGATATGAAFAAAGESIISGHSFGSIFMRDFNNSSWFLASTVAASPALGGFVDAGAKTPWSGYVQTGKGMGALTLGSATAFAGVSPAGLIGDLSATTYLQHEFGHTLQFVLMSLSGKNPWTAYLDLGVLGLAGLSDLPRMGPGCAGCLFEWSASWMGRHALPTSHGYDIP